MFSTGNISPNYSVTIDSTPPRPRDPYEAFLCDDLHRAHYGTSSHVEAISHPATLRGQRQDVYLKLLPQSLCIRVKELCRGSAAQLAKGRNDCATLFRCAGDGNCATHALLNGLKRGRNQVRLDKKILPTQNVRTNSRILLPRSRIRVSRRVVSKNAYQVCVKCTALETDEHTNTHTATL